MDHIVIVNDQAAISGGAPLVAISSARALAEMGRRVVFFAGVGPITDELRHPNIQVHCLGLSEILTDKNRVRAAVHGLWNQPARTKLARVLSGLPREGSVVHYHGWMKSLSPAVLNVAEQCGFRTVLTAHDYFSVCPTGGFYNFRKQEVCKLKPLSVRCIASRCDPRNYRHKMWRCMRSLGQTLAGGVDGIDKVFCVSPYSASILKGYIKDPSKLVVVNNPAPVVKMPQTTRDCDAPLLYVGRLSEEKGLKLLAAACSGCPERLVIIGDGPLREQAKLWFPGATFTGWLPRDQVHGWMRRARAVVFPSLWYETAGLVVIEAAGNGCPSIVSDGCAARDYVVNGVTGLTFRAGETEALRGALSKMSTSEEARTMGDAAYEWYWRSPWTVERHAAALCAEYDRL